MGKAIWKNRITKTGEKPAKDFLPNPLNWRTHPEFQRQALSGILSEVGWVTGVIENVVTGNVIDGHARIEEALAQSESTLVPFIQVELTEDEEKKILAVLDPIGALAGTDDERLRELSSILEFESDSLRELMARREVAEVNLGDFFTQNPNDNPLEKFIVELEFTTETEQNAVLEKLGGIASTPGEAVKKLLNL